IAIDTEESSQVVRASLKSRAIERAVGKHQVTLGKGSIGASKALDDAEGSAIGVDGINRALPEITATSADAVKEIVGQHKANAKIADVRVAIRQHEEAAAICVKPEQ